MLGLARAWERRSLRALSGPFNERSLDLADPDALSALAGDRSDCVHRGAVAPAHQQRRHGCSPVGPPAQQDASAIARTVSLNVAAPLILPARFAAQIGRPCDPPRLRRCGASCVSGAGASIARRPAALDQHASGVAHRAIPAVRICKDSPRPSARHAMQEVRAPGRYFCCASASSR